MKKSLLAASAASLAVAAMPMAGVFAAVNTVYPGESMIDHIRLTVLKTCEMDVDATAVSPATNPASYENLYDLGSSTVAHVFDGDSSADGYVAGAGVTGTAMTITCNAEGANHAAGWNLSAIATPLEREANDAHAIPFGAFVSTGADSVWSAQLAVSKTGTSTMPTDFSDYYAVTSGWTTFAGEKSATTDTVIVSGTAGYSVDGLVVTPSYKAYGASTQPVGTYNGKITYTLHDLTPAPSQGD